MSTMLHKRSLLKKTAQVSGSTLLSRLLGLTRDILLVRYLGKGAVSDAFRVAWKMPNMLRQIFAEGALSPAFVPTVVGLVKQGKKEEVNGLMALTMMVFEGTLGLICLFVALKAPWVIAKLAPGFQGYQAELTARLLRILISFIFFVSSSALVAGVLQASNHFWVPALSPVVNNVFFITGLSLGIGFGISVQAFCAIVVLGGLVQLLMHFVVYRRLGFSLGGIHQKIWDLFYPVLYKFLPAMISGSVMQVSLLVDTYFASYLPAGSVTLIDIASGFVRIPLGVLVVSFSTILLPHFSRVSTYAPLRLRFYLLEATKLICWFTIPATVLLAFFAESIFETLFLSDHFSYAAVLEGKLILIAFLLGLFFLSMNKILLSMYYALHELWIPAIITVSAIGMNIFLCRWWVGMFQATGLAVATSVSAAIQTVLFITILRFKCKVKLYGGPLIEFLYRYLVQLGVVLSLFYLIYRSLLFSIGQLSASMVYLLTRTIGLWVWVTPLIGALVFVLLKTREFFGVRLYFVKRG